MEEEGKAPETSPEGSGPEGKDAPASVLEVPQTPPEASSEAPQAMPERTSPPPPIPEGSMKEEEKEISLKDGDLAPMLLIESALFSAGRPLSEEEITESTGLDPQLVVLYLKKLSLVYSRRETSLEVIKAGRKYVMRVREQYVPKVSPLTEPEIPQKLIKTAALIAYHQPMKQSDLVEMYGAKVYEHVKELMKLGLVIARQDGSTKLLTTTQRFAEVFGIGAISKKKVKGYVRDRTLEKVEKISKMTLEGYSAQEASGEKEENEKTPSSPSDEKIVDQ